MKCNMKKCYKCQQEKYETEFGKLTNSPDGLKYDCKMCRSEYNKANRDKISQRNKNYYQINKSELLKKNKNYRDLNSEKIKEQKKEYRNKLENIEHIKNKNKEYLPIRKEKIKQKRKTDLNFKISEILRSKFNREIKRNKYSKFLGCDISFLKKWLEYRFTNNMSWNNMGSYWHVDHILPISKFDLKNQNEIQICYHWSNLQPLETFENISKSNNIHLHTYFNNLVSLFRFNAVYKDFIGYQAVNESLQWLRKKNSGTVIMPRMILPKMANEIDNPHQSS